MKKTLNEQVEERESRSGVEASLVEKLEQLDTELSYVAGDLLRHKREYAAFRAETIQVINNLAKYIERATQVQHGGEETTTETS